MTSTLKAIGSVPPPVQADPIGVMHHESEGYQRRLVRATSDHSEITGEGFTSMTTTAKQCRDGNRCQPVTLREAWHCQIVHSEARVEDLARRISMQPATLYEAVNPTSIQSLPAARHHELLLELTSDNLAVVTYLSRKQTAVVVRVNEATTMQQISDTLREFSEFVSATADASIDGTYTVDEALRMKQEGFDAIGSIVTLVKDAERRAGAPQSRVLPIDRRA